MYKIFRYFFLFCILMGCQTKKLEQPSPVLMLHQMGKLATAEYIITKIVRATDNATWYKLGDRKMLITCKASIKAGVDLTKVTDSDVSIQDKKINIQLPAAEIITLSIQPEDIKVEYEETTLFRDKFTAAERDFVMQQAEKQIRKQAQTLNILTTAKENAATFVRTFFTSAGYENVNVSFK